MTPAAHVVHQTPGRMRIRVPSKRGDSEFFKWLEHGLAGFPGVTSVAANPLTAGVLLQHAGDAKDILAYARAQGFFDVQPAGSLQERADANLEEVSRTLRRVSGGEVDLNSIMVVALTALAVQQAIEGNIVAPAVTMMWYALDLVRGRK